MRHMRVSEASNAYVAACAGKVRKSQHGAKGPIMMENVVRARLGAAVAAFTIWCCASAAWSGEQTGGEERIPFALPSLQAVKMPPVFFSHERHVTSLEAQGKDCATCHAEDNSGMSEYFMSGDRLPPDRRVAHVHAACADCHAAVKSPAPSGPLLVHCRSCHSDGVAAAQGKKAGS